MGTLNMVETICPTSGDNHYILLHVPTGACTVQVPKYLNSIHHQKTCRVLCSAAARESLFARSLLRTDTPVSALPCAIVETLANCCQLNPGTPQASRPDCSR